MPIRHSGLFTLQHCWMGDVMDSPGAYEDWDQCDCRKHLPNLIDVMCGCGSHQIPIQSEASDLDVIVHWLGEHWTIICAFDEATSLADKFHSKILAARKSLVILDDDVEMTGIDSDYEE